jgi:arylsulfatase A-like enzyme
MHMVYFNGFVQTDDWSYERWDGYETDALLGYAEEFLDDVGAAPFCLFVSPHQPHWTPFEFAPERFYDGLPEEPELPANVPEGQRAETAGLYRHYLAMTRALDEMVGNTLDYLDRTGRAENTLVVFTSDHGSQVGAHAPAFWDDKRRPYEESLHVPCLVRLPGVLEAGATRDCLTAPVDFLPTLCGLCGLPVPPTVEGMDLSDAWRGLPEAREQDAVMTMNFSGAFDSLAPGLEWRGVRTKTHAYARWLDGREELYDIRTDPLERGNMASQSDSAELLDSMRNRLAQLQAERGDRLMPAEAYRDWFDAQRRVVRNAFGSLDHPESDPPWSLLD